MEDAKLYFAQKEQRWYNTAFIFFMLLVALEVYRST